MDGQAEQELVVSWPHPLHAVAVEARYSSNQAAVVAAAVVGYHRAVMLSWQVVYLLPVVLRSQKALCSLAAAGGVAAADVAVDAGVAAADVVADVVVAADPTAADVAVAGVVAAAGVAAGVPGLQRCLVRQ